MNNDLISRSALLEAINAIPNSGGTDVTSSYEEWMRMKIKSLAVEAAPAVDAEPVRHGRWIPFGHDDAEEGLYKCSVCAKKQYNGFGDIEEYLKYCPECGAKIDAEVEG